MRALLIILLQSSVLVSSQVLDGYFVDLASNWTSEQSVNNSLVSTPQLTFLNDTATSFQWTLQTSNLAARLATNFDLEISFSLYSDDFVNYASIVSQVPEDFSNNSFSDFYTVSGLNPDSDYRFRICPEFATGRGVCSDPLSVTTLPVAINYWEPILSRRLSLAASGRGFTNPVLQRPHLDTGVEVFKSRTSNNTERYSDPVTSKTPVLPSGRRGHTLSLVDDQVYMFGGRTNGYSCATVYKDTLDLGNSDSGRDIYPCVHYQGEVNELWAFDVSTYQWSYINTLLFHTPPLPTPPAREQHSSVVINRDVYIFGGKSRFFTKSADGSFIYVPHSDHVYNDLWKLSVERARSFSLTYKHTHTIPDSSVYYATISGFGNSSVSRESDGVTPREGLCIDKVTVKVQLYHPCLTQVRATIQGPGSLSGSANFFSPAYGHEIVLFSDLTTNGTGCVGGIHNFQFDDESNRLVEDYYSVYNGVFRPQGKLSEFIGASMTANWTLTLTDTEADLNTGYLIDWSLHFTSSPCYRSYTWTNLTASVASGAPVARFAAKTLTHGNNLFVYGGRDTHDTLLHDLHRYNIRTHIWTTLTPVNFDIALNPSSAVGGNFLLTSWGLIRYSGYYRQPTMSTVYSNYDSSVEIQDPVTLRWKELMVDTEGDVLAWDATFGRAAAPSSRYLSASVFIPSHTLSRWRTAYDHHQLYDKKNSSSRTNYAGSIADSIFTFGGFDGSTGSTIDGSSAGYLNDHWMLRLANYSTAGTRASQQSYLEKNCRWRVGTSAITGSVTSSGTNNCITGSNNAKCEFRDLLLLPWCAGNNQTVV